MKNKTKIKISKSTIALLALSFFIPFTVAVIGLIRGNFSPFGKNNILTSGGYASTLTYYLEFYNRFHSGEAFSFSVKSGLGYDFTSVLAYFLSDPLDLLILHVPATSVFIAINFLYAIKIGLAGLFFSIFLRYHEKNINSAISGIDKSLYVSKKKKVESDEEGKKKSFRIGGTGPVSGAWASIMAVNPLILGFSVAYALSGYMLTYGMNISYLTAVAILPLVIMGIEKLVNEGKPLFYIITMCLSFYCSFYISCITFVFTVLYGILMTYKDTVHKLKSFIKIVISDLIIFGLASPIILNSVSSVFFKKSTTLNFPSFALFTSLFDVIKRQLTTAEPSQLIRYGNGINIFCGVFVIVTIFLFIMNRAIPYSDKLKRMGLFAVLLSATYMTTPNYFFNFFLESNDKNCVFAYILIFTTLVVSYEAFKYLEFNTTLHVLLSGAISVILIICSLLLCVGYDSISVFISGLEFTAFYLLLLLLWKEDNMAEHASHIALGALIFIEILITYSGGMARFSEYEVSYYDSKEFKYSAIEDYIHKTEPTARILTYEANRTDSTPVTNAILGYDYVITQSGTSPMDSNLLYVESYNDIDIYFNPDSIHGGIFIDKSVDLWNNSSSSKFTSINLFAKCIADCDNIFDFTIGDFSVEEIIDSADKKVDYSSYLHNSENRFTYTLEDSGDFYTNLSHIMHVGQAKAGEPISLAYTSTQEDAKTELLGGEFALFNSENYEEFLSNITINSTYDMYNIDIDAPSDGYVLIPVESSENIKINDSSSKPKSLELNGDFVTLIPVTQGHNQIGLSYENPNISLSAILSIMAIILAAVFLILLKKASSDSKVIDKTAAFFYNNRVYLYTMLITTTLFIIFLMMNKCIPFGTRSAVVSDGYAQTYPSYTKLISDLRSSKYGPFDYSIGYYGNGRSAWSWMAFMNPTWFLGFLFPASQSMMAFNFVFFVTYLLTGPSIIFYLTHRSNGKAIDKRDLKLIPIALAYNLSSFAFMYFSFVGFDELCVFTPLIILTMENVIYKKKYLPYILLLTYVMLWSYYMAFLLCEFLFLYFFISEFKNFKDFFFKGLRFGICSLVCVGLAAFYLLPAYSGIQTNNYVSTDVAMRPGFSLENSMLRNLLDMQVMPRVNLVTEYSHRANTYCGLLCLLILGVFLTKKSIGLSVRIRRVLLILLLYFSYSNPFMNYIFHGFHIQSMVPNRFAIFFIFVMISILVDCLFTNEETENKKELISFLVSAGVILALMLVNNIGNSVYLSLILTILFIVVYATIYIYGYIRKNKSHKIQLLASALVLELILSFLYMGNRVGGMEVAIKGNDVETIKTLSKEYSMQDYPLMRSEIVATDLINSSILTDINSISIFTSMLDSGVTGLSKHWNTMTGKNYIQYDTGNPLGNIMLNVRYFITNDFSDTNIVPHYMNEVETIGNIHLYEDPGYVGNGIIFDKTYNLDKYENKYNNSFDQQNAFSQLFVHDNLYNIIEVETDINNATEDASYIMMGNTSSTGVTPARIYISKDTIGDVYMDYYGQITYLGYSKGTEQEFYEVNLYDHENTQSLYDETVRLAIINPDCITKLQTALSTDVLQDMKVTSNNISGIYDSGNEGTVYISLPFLSSWKAYVDGSEVPVKFFLSGMGVDVPAGNHSVELRYEPSGTNYSYFVSLFTLLLVIGYIIKLKVEKKKTIV